MLADTGSDEPFGARWRTLDTAPDGAAWAVVSTPEHPPLAEHNPGAVHWRSLHVDPDLVGLVPGRARPAHVAIEPAAWTLPVPGLLAGRLAWHPHRPLVAGLAVEGRRAHPWVADYEACTVTTYEHVHAATALTALGGGHRPAVAWCGDDRIALLTPGQAASPPSAPAPGGLVQPGLYEATGPAHVMFAPGLDTLDGLAAACVTIMDTRTGTATPLTSPLLARAVSPSADGEHLLIEYAVNDDPDDEHGLRWGGLLIESATGTPLRELPPGAAWALDADVLAWPVADGVGFGSTTDAEQHLATGCALPSGRWWAAWRGGAPAVVFADRGALHLLAGTGPHELALPDRAVRIGRPVAGRGLTFDCAHRDGRVGLATVHVEPPSVTVAWAPADGETPAVRLPPQLPAPGRATKAAGSSFAVSTGVGQARLTVLPAADRTAPQLLWLRAVDEGRPPAGPSAPVLVSAVGCPAAVLDLPLHWPSDATVEHLHAQIVAAVQGSLELLGGGDRVVVGGHSFGATLALYALAHVPELAAGIAHSGCYNRTHTPTGFQYERRSYWQVPTLYEAFSALHFADRLDRPVLLVHGAEDANPSTPPEQAVDLYRAVVANGGHARLVLLPGEGHTLRYADSLHAVTAEHRRWIGQAARVAEGSR